MVNTNKNNTFSGWTWLGRILATLGALGTILSNYLAFLSFINDLGRLSLAASQSLAVIVGGAFSGVVNLWMNLDLLEAFFKRFTTKDTQPKLSGWRKFRYYAGSLVFLVTGALFGMTAFAFGGFGLWASLGIASGLLVAVIMMIQELETWWQSFDGEYKKASFKEAFTQWFKNLTPAKTVGIIISIGNVFALSLLFALGLTNFLTMVGIPLVPALIAGFVVAFTCGAFTEFYFYNFFLANFCEKIAEKWNNFLKLSPINKVMGIISVLINAAVNAVSCYAGIVLLNTLMASTGLSIIPLAAIITVATFCGLASLILGSDFWTRMLLPKAVKEGYSKVDGHDKGTERNTQLSPSGADLSQAVTVMRKEQDAAEVMGSVPAPSLGSATEPN